MIWGVNTQYFWKHPYKHKSILWCLLQIFGRFFWWNRIHYSFIGRFTICCGKKYFQCLQKFTFILCYISIFHCQRPSPKLHLTTWLFWQVLIFFRHVNDRLPATVRLSIRTFLIRRLGRKTRNFQIWIMEISICRSWTNSGEPGGEKNLDIIYIYIYK